MTKEEEKAKALVERFLLPITQRYVEQNKEVGKGEIATAKQCAIISMEIVKEEVASISIKRDVKKVRMEYYDRIINEIKKL